MAYSTVQRVALASGLVLAVSLLLPKAFLPRGKRQEPPPAPEGKRGAAPPEPPPGVPATSGGEPCFVGGVTPGVSCGPQLDTRQAGRGRRAGRVLGGTKPQGSFGTHRQLPSSPGPLLTFKGQECVHTCWVLSRGLPHPSLAAPSADGTQARSGALSLDSHLGSLFRVSCVCCRAL